MNVLPVKWEAMKRGIEFWVHVMVGWGGHEGSYEVGKQSEMGEQFEDWFRLIWVARVGHAGIEWTVDEWSEARIEVHGMEER